MILFFFYIKIME